MAILRALLYLRLTTLRNRVRSSLRRLRQPKYLLGALAAIAYFWFFFFRGTRNGRGPVHAFEAMLAPDRIEIVAAIVLTLFIALIWVAPSDQPGLAFSEAEVAFLFPAPLARSQLIHYKLLNGLFASLIGALFFTLIAGGMNHGALGALRRLGAWWSFNANLTLHQTAAALTITRLSTLGLTSGPRRTLIIAGLIVGLLAILLFAVSSGTASVAWLLLPARWAVGPFLAATPGAYLLSLLPAVSMVAIHYFWIFRMEVPFEEASIALAQKRGEALALARAGKRVHLGGKVRARSGPFRLGDRLPPEAAFLWKNLMAAPSYLNRKVYLAAIAFVVLGLTWLKRHPDFGGPKIAAMIGVTSLVLLVYVLLFGPQLARNDLRGDLPQADMLKAYPLPGWRIVLGSLLAPTVILTAMTWLLLLVATLGLDPPAGKTPWLTPQLRLSAGLALALLMPVLCAVQLLVPNAATLIFPAWAQSGRNTGGGMDAMGQRLIFFAGQFVCLLIALLPALLTGALTLFLTQWLIGPSLAVVLATLPMLAIFVAELWLGVRLLGPRFERLDISAELRP